MQRWASSKFNLGKAFRKCSDICYGQKVISVSRPSLSPFATSVTFATLYRLFNQKYYHCETIQPLIHMKCLNCQTEYAGSFCPECGQKAGVGRLTLPGILAQFFQSLTNADRGLLFNWKQLTLAPRRTVSDYLAGKRAGVFPPAQYLLLAISLYLLLDHYFRNSIAIDLGADIHNLETYQFGYAYGKFLRSNIKFFWILNVLFFALPSRLFFPRYNLAEHLTVQSFVLAQAVFAGCLFFPVYHLAILFNPFIYGSIFVLLAAVFWKEAPKWEVLLKVGAILFLGYLLFFLAPLPFHYLFSRGWG